MKKNRTKSIIDSKTLLPLNSSVQINLTGERILYHTHTLTHTSHTHSTHAHTHTTQQLHTAHAHTHTRRVPRDPPRREGIRIERVLESLPAGTFKGKGLLPNTQLASLLLSVS
jgi:hypothetical protein